MTNENLDKSITDSVKEIVKKNNQGDDLAAKILSWLDAIHSGKESLEDKNAYITRVEVLMDATKDDIYGK
uniref:CxC ATPase DNA modification system associated small protein n=1 Tax=Limnohabitans sp. TaxID=1907725 RepID=UPI00404793C6